MQRDYTPLVDGIVAFVGKAVWVGIDALFRRIAAAES